MKALSFIAIILLTACTTTPKTPTDIIYLAHVNYNAAKVGELTYVTLPRCGLPTSPKACSDKKIIKDIKNADYVAGQAILAAEATVRTPGYDKDKITIAITGATNAVTAFANIVNKYKGK